MKSVMGKSPRRGIEGTMKKPGRVEIFVVASLLLMTSLVVAGGGPNVSGAKLYIQQNELDKALEVLNKEITERDPNNEDAWYLMGYIYARQGKYDKMKESFDKAVALKPEFKEKGLKISKDSGSLFHSQFGADMITRMIWGNVFNEAVKSFNDGINATDEAARAAGYEKAIAEFRTSTQLMPDSAMAYRNMAAALLNLGRYDESVEPLEAAIDRNPKDHESRLMLAQVYMTAGKDSLAMPILQQLWDGGQRSEEVADNLARAFIRAGKVEEAKNIYKDALDQNPNNYQFRYNYGTILLEAEEYDAAIEHLGKAYEIDSSSSDINYNLGAAYLNRGVAQREKMGEDSQDESYKKDFEKAFPYLEHSVKLNPDDQQIWMTLGRIAGQLNKISLAGYAFSKGDNVRSALDQKMIVGMQTDALLTIFGEPDKKNPIESNEFSSVEEWVYGQRAKAAGKVAIPKPVRVYVMGGRVDALAIEN